MMSNLDKLMNGVPVDNIAVVTANGKPKHTAGPWKVAIVDNVRHYPQVHTEDGRVLARLTDLYCTPTQTEANAALIAAAPEMLEVLKSLAMMAETFLSEQFTDHPNVVEAFKVINKAENKA